ncbi:hypothetical protein EMCG_03390 [[Emmonsia] crescens]|uniref:Phosphotyrosine protein phosphatase I domain-containing protein n=1 Tax=[Emmonsia] crescens TaxID=73230 RepID=A0A0G2J8F6_9EURO|nr:hypothetical protein EMCG_03390 [Emmonsia crescens UAMH 3008]
MAEAIFRHQVTSSPLKFSTIDSAGTAAYHTNSPPDSRTMSTLRAHHITTYTHAARQIRQKDFVSFDYILAMDGENLENLMEERGRVVRAGNQGEERGEGMKYAQVRLIGDFLPDGSAVEKVGGGEVVGDPYYGGKEGFEEVYRQLVRLSEGFLKFLEKGGGGD